MTPVPFVRIGSRPGGLSACQSGRVGFSGRFEGSENEHRLNMTRPDGPWATSSVLPRLDVCCALSACLLVSVCHVLPRGAMSRLYVHYTTIQHARTHISVHTDKPHHARSAWQSIRVQPSFFLGGGGLSGG